MELTGFLQQVFACTPQVAEAIAARAAERRYEAEATILRQGDESRETYLLVVGRAQARVYGRDGQMALLREYLSGDMFGTIAEARPGAEEADVVAVEAASAAAFAAVDFLLLFEAHACIGLAVSRMLMRQLRAQAAQFAARATLSAQGRVYAELLRLARLGDGFRLEPLVLAALATRVQTTRETASRAISALERRGLLKREAAAWRLTAPQRLEDLVV